MRTRVKRKAHDITIYDVAKDADVSPATVSRVINNSAVVRAERRARVQASIEKLKFKPNEIARGLARQTSAILGVLVPDVCRSEANELLSGIVDTANLKRYNYSITINSYVGLGDITSFCAQVEKMVANRVDGLLIMADEMTEEMNNILQNVGIPVVLFATPNKYKDLPSVSLNYQKVGHDIVAYIVQQAYHNVTILMRDHEVYNMGLAASFAESCHKQKIDLEKQLIPAAFDYEKAYQMIYERYKHTPIPKIVFATNDMLALAFNNAIQDLGNSVPEDVEIISFSNTQLALVGRPQITSVMYPVYRIGAYAMSMITKLIQNEPVHGILALENEYEIIWRGSTKGKKEMN